MRHDAPNESRRTFTKQDIDDARKAWDAGDFSPEWREWRHMAAMKAGIIVPPSGTKWDQWGDDEPTERAILIRAIRETPEALRAVLASGRVHTWAQVIRLLVQGRDRVSADALDREHQDRLDPYKHTAAQDRVALTGIQTILDGMRSSGRTAAEVASDHARGD